MDFVPHPLAADRKRSATILTKLLLQQVHTPGVIAEQLDELIDKMLWKLTEADGKHNTRHRSEGALGVTDRKLIVHEHVFQKKKMIADLRKATCEEKVDEILQSAVGCVVTKGEHDRLSHLVDRDGWDRYRHAGIRVRNLATGSWET